MNSLKGPNMNATIMTSMFISPFLHNSSVLLIWNGADRVPCLCSFLSFLSALMVTFQDWYLTGGTQEGNEGALTGWA